MDAKLVLGLCARFGCLPSQLEQEDAEIMRLVNIVAEGTRTEGVNDGEPR